MVVSVRDTCSGISLEEKLEEISPSINSQSGFGVPQSVRLLTETSHRWPGSRGSSSGCLTIGILSSHHRWRSTSPPQRVGVARGGEGPGVYSPQPRVWGPDLGGRRGGDPPLQRQFGVMRAQRTGDWVWVRLCHLSVTLGKLRTLSGTQSPSL